MSNNHLRPDYTLLNPNTNPATSTTRQPSLIRPRVAPAEKPIEMAQVPLDRGITSRQAAVILGVSTETLKKWRQRSGKGPKFMKYPDGAIRYRLHTVLQFMDDGAVER